MRGNQFLEAGSRNKYTSETIPFTYEALLADMTQAMDKLQAEGVNVVNTPITKEVYSEPKKVDFDAVDAQIKTIAKALKTADKFDRYTEVVEKILGKGKKVKDCQKDQGDLLELILDDLKDVIKEEGVEIY